MKVPTLAALGAARLSGGMWVLAVINVLLFAMLVVVVFRGTQADEILATSGKPMPSTPIDVAVPVFAANYESIVAQPLFHTSRSFFVAPDPAAAVAALPPPPDQRLAGVMTLEKGKTIAFLVHNQTGARSRVRRGDSVEGWIVEDVSSQRVVISQNGQRHELTTARPAGAAPGGMQTANAAMLQAPMSAQAPMSTQSGIRFLSGGPGRPNQNSSNNVLPPAPPGGVGARLYRPPPGQ